MHFFLGFFKVLIRRDHNLSLSSKSARKNILLRNPASSLVPRKNVFRAVLLLKLRDHIPLGKRVQAMPQMTHKIRGGKIGGVRVIVRDGIPAWGDVTDVIRGLLGPALGFGCQGPNLFSVTCKAKLITDNTDR